MWSNLKKFDFAKTQKSAFSVTSEKKYYQMKITGIYKI